jgi:hypothetical protein
VTQETAEKWESVDVRDEVRKHLGRDVGAVKLPQKVLEEQTYPWLIIDGASGVGKTQQAFAMLKSTEQPYLVYQLLIPERGTEQPIHSQMRTLNYRISAEMGFLTFVEGSMQYANTARIAEDPFSFVLSNDMRYWSYKKIMNWGG